jgi:chromosome segregation ATPase
MEWLQQHMRNHLAEIQGETNVLSLRPHPIPVEDVCVRALKLIERAIQYIQDTEQEAVERHARADTLARNAMEELNSAEERVGAAESARRAAEARIDGATAKLREMEGQLERTAANAAAAQTKISATEKRAREAENRAAEAENALKRIETVIHAIMLEKRLSDPRGEVAA